MENIFVEFLPPWVETGLQPAFYDKESGTVLQQTARMYARVNMLIRMFNKLSKNTKETVEEYINKFNELHNYVEDYFENLDVQEEINNKLDAMAEAGTLADIIADYIQLKGILAYDTVADLKNATNIVDGSFVETYGYYAKGDGGGAKYKIRTITNDDTVDETILIEITADPTNTLVAEIVTEPTMNVKQFGCKVYDVNNPYDNHDKLTTIMGLGLSKLTFTKDEYLISLVTVSNPIVIDGCGATCLINNSVHEGGIFDIRSTNDCTIKNMNIETLSHNFNEDGRGLQINSSYNVTVEECTFKDMNGDGIIIAMAGITTADDTHHIYIHNNKFIGNSDSRNAVTVFNGNNIVIEDNYFETFTKNNMPACIDIEPWLDNEYLFLHDIYVRNNTSIKNHGFCANLAVSFTSVDAYNIVFENNYVVLDDAGTSGGFAAICTLTENQPNFDNIVIRSNTIICTDNQNLGIMLEGVENVTIDDNYLKNGLITVDGSLSFANNLPCDKCYVTNNTFVKDAYSSVVGSTLISIRMKTNQVMNVINNKLIYIGSGLDYVTPIVFLSASTVPYKINVLSNIVSRTHTTHTESKLCNNYQPTRIGNVGEGISDLNQS